MNTIHKISFVGYGNVATHLSKAFHNKGIDITHVCGPKSEIAISLANAVDAVYIDSLADLPKDQLTIVCVPDDDVKEVISNLDPSIPAVYTSGFQQLNAISEREKIGVFYPLQTFSRNIELDLSDVPIFIESENPKFQEQLIALGEIISTNVHIANSEHRKKIHEVAVWVNNFTNHIIHHAQELARENNVSFEHLKPLLKETINKLDYISAYEAQTGPARRGDVHTTEKQSSELPGIRKELYDLITKSISDTYLP